MCKNPRQSQSGLFHFLLYSAVLFVLSLPSNIHAQIITSAEPSVVYPGQQHATIKISGMGTSFAQGKTTIDMGPYISVSSVAVQSTATLQAIVSVSTAAISGNYNITVTTKTAGGNKVVIMPGGISIIPLGGPVHATILVNPVQSIRLADFNPGNIADAPLLFTVTVYNNNMLQNLNLVVTLSGQKLGLLATGTRKLRNMAPNAVATVDDRQFDKYTVTNINNPAIQGAIKTGNIPSDIYTYNVQVLNDSGRVVASTNGTNTITDQENKPELMNPGNPIFSDPPLINTRFPVFQWFSKANSFSFNLFEVKPGQKSGPEIILNRPLYVQNYFNNSTLIYPADAEMLEEGHTYAWQVIANYTTSAGATSIQSDLFWFTVAVTPFTKKTQTISDMRVDPGQASIAVGKSCKFIVKSLDIQNDTIQIKPEWTVVPAEGGTIDSLGNFTAGIHARSVAVIATYKGISDYSTVDIIDPDTKPENTVRPKKPDSDFNPRLK